MTTYDHPEWLALMREYIENPRGQEPILADWLEEHGEEERAEFVRVQCELAAIVEPTGDTRVEVDEKWAECENWRATLRRRERELLDENGNAWDEDFHNGIGANEPHYYRFGLTRRRGFASEITCSAEDFLAHEAVLVWCPTKCFCTRYSDSYIANPACPACSGTGKVPPTMVCPECKGTCEDGGDVNDRGVVGWCVKCYDSAKGESSGRVPRPFTATAQPITTVRLTTHPFTVEGWGPMVPRNSDYNTFTSGCWPGITFHLPRTFDEVPDLTEARRDSD